MSADAAKPSDPYMPDERRRIVWAIFKRENLMSIFEASKMLDDMDEATARGYLS